MQCQLTGRTHVFRTLAAREPRGSFDRLWICFRPAHVSRVLPSRPAMGFVLGCLTDDGSCSCSRNVWSPISMASSSLQIPDLDVTLNL